MWIHKEPSAGKEKITAIGSVQIRDFVLTENLSGGNETVVALFTEWNKNRPFLVVQDGTTKISFPSRAVARIFFNACLKYLDQREILEGEE